jgi:hypothetical protein
VGYEESQESRGAGGGIPGIQTCGVLRVPREQRGGWWLPWNTDLWGMKSLERAEERLVGGFGPVGYEESPEGRGAGGGKGGYGPVGNEESPEGRVAGGGGGGGGIRTCGV